MKSILQSINPKYCELIASGKKTIEVRKTKPKFPTPFKVYIYCTKARIPIRHNGRILMYEDDLAITNRWGQGKRVENPCGSMMAGELFLNGKVIGEYVCNKIDEMSHCGNCSNDIKLRLLDEYFCAKDLVWEYLNKCQLPFADLVEYSNGGNIYGWHISDLKIYDKPKELSNFRKPIDCHRGKQKDNCIGCWDCEIKHPPQSWCYVEEV